jgi:hypothetical protein
MSERTARQWRQGPLPSATKVPRGWRTREDPFEAVWGTLVEPLLVADTDGKLEAKTVLEELIRRRPEDFAVRHLRTLQRRVRLWRAEHGPVKEVYFPQEHVPGRLGAIDFTHASELRVTILGSLFRHLFFELVLAFSGLRFVQLAFGETFEALLSGLQAALWHAGGVPEVVRLDNLSAATHQLKETGGRALTKRFADVAAHYGFTASRIRPGEGHENGVVEKGHDVLKGALEQALLLRGSRDFASVDAYLVFVGDIVERKLHAGRADRIAVERAALRRLPATRLPEYTRVQAVVRKWSTVHLGGRTYSVPSRLIGHVIDARVFADVVTVHLPGVEKPLETMPRLRGETHHRIDYRHVIWSLVRKPGAFAAYRYREDLFPSLVFRRAFDALRAARGDRADVEYVRILHLAASTTEHVVEAALATLLEKMTPFDYVAVKAIAQPEQPAIPDVHIGSPDLASYDALLIAGEAS